MTFSCRKGNLSFREQIAAKYGALNIVVEKVADSQAAGRDVILDIIASYPELRGVFASSLIYCDLLRS
jgi:ABC-type sugar transport system substrate-binding protein